MRNSTEDLLRIFFERYDSLEFLKENIISVSEMICNAAKADRLVLVCGNGGSSADSEHMAAELLKAFLLPRPVSSETKDELIGLLGEKEGDHIACNLQQGIRCIPLTSFSAFSTAFINDCDPDMLFAQLVNVLGREEDVLIAISTSGNSANVCHAAKIAKAKRMKVISLTGENGGKLKEFSDVLLNVPSTIVYRIQEYHLPLYHLICSIVENELFGE